MEQLLQELNTFIKHSIDHSLGVFVPSNYLQLKVQSLKTSNHVLQNQYLAFLSKLRQREETHELAKGEACLNAPTIKKFVENHKLTAECASLVNQYSKSESDCSLYDHDREALMDFGNEVDERVRDSYLEDEVK